MEHILSVDSDGKPALDAGLYDFEIGKWQLVKEIEDIPGYGAYTGDVGPYCSDPDTFSWDVNDATWQVCGILADMFILSFHSQSGPSSPPIHIGSSAIGIEGGLSWVGSVGAGLSRLAATAAHRWRLVMLLISRVPNRP